MPIRAGFQDLAGRGKAYMPNAIIDLAELLARVENDRGLMRELLLIFKDEFPGHLQALRDAVDSMDGDRVTAEAHTLKGMLSNLAATSAADAAARRQQLGQNREISKFQQPCSVLASVSKCLMMQSTACLDTVH